MILPSFNSKVKTNSELIKKINVKEIRIAERTRKYKEMFKVRSLEQA